MEILNDFQKNHGSGWISIYRTIRNHWIWIDPIKLKWWLDILIEVNHSGQKVNLGYDLFECERGQSVKSLLNWAKQWGVSKDTVRNFFTLLKKDGMIKTENLKKTTRLTVCNYDTYQSGLHAKQTQGKRKANARQTQGDPNNNGNNANNEDKFNFKKSLLYLGVEKQIVDDWMLVRKKKDATNTITSFNRIKSQIEKSNRSANECIKIAVEKDWKGFNADWLKNSNEEKKANSNQPRYKVL